MATKKFPSFHGCAVEKDGNRLRFVLPFEGAPNGHLVVWSVGNNTTDEIVYETGKRDVLYEAAKLAAKKTGTDGSGNTTIDEADDVWFPRFREQNKRVILGQIKRPYKKGQTDLAHAIDRLARAGYGIGEAAAALEAED